MKQLKPPKWRDTLTCRILSHHDKPTNTRVLKTKTWVKKRGWNLILGKNTRKKWEVKTQYLGKVIQLRHLKGNLDGLVVSLASHASTK